ncbi:hypothetical protein ACFE04_024803 [Oxalis oulophora]
MKYYLFSENPVQKSNIFSSLIKHTNYSTISHSEVETAPSVRLSDQSPSLSVLKSWGCSEEDISSLLLYSPCLRNVKAETLESKLSLLTVLGLTSADLVKIIHCRPRFFKARLDCSFEKKVQYFTELFGSKDKLREAITRNPSLLVFDFTGRIKPVIELYEGMGLSRKELITMLLSRPNLIPQTSIDDEKLEYIRKSGVQKDSKMYKYVVAVIGTSRIETIRTNVANFEKFGLSNDEIWGLVGRAPYLLQLSVDKVQRNMTFILGTMKLPASVVLKRSFLLLSSLEMVIKPRVLLLRKIKEMGLYRQTKESALFTALKMTENQFLKTYVNCHPKEVEDTLLEVYNNAKCIKRLAETSKKNTTVGYHF